MVFAGPAIDSCSKMTNRNPGSTKRRVFRSWGGDFGGHESNPPCSKERKNKEETKDPDNQPSAGFAFLSFRWAAKQWDFS